MPPTPFLALKSEVWILRLKFLHSNVKLEILNLDIERDLEGSGNHFFTWCLKSKWAWWVLETSEKEHFLWLVLNPNGHDNVWKGMKTSFLQNIWNPNGPNEVWKVLKKQFSTIFQKPKWAWQGLKGSENHFFTKHSKSKGA